MCIYLAHRQIHSRMPLLSKCLFDPLKQLSLPGILFCVAQQHCSLWQGMYEFLQGFLKRQHTCRTDRYIIHPRIQKSLWWFCESVRVLVLLSHAKLVCSMIFLAFGFPACTEIWVVFKFAWPSHCWSWKGE